MVQTWWHRSASVRWIDRLLWLALAGLAAATLFALAARQITYFDLFTHFRVQYAVGAGAVALTALLLRRWMVVIAAVACAVPHLIVLESLVLPPPLAAAQAGAPPAAQILRLTTMNVAQNNTAEAPALSYIKATRPDVLILQEASGTTHPLVRSLIELYPYHVSDEPAEHPKPILFSRFPILSQGFVTPSGGGPAYVEAKLDVAGGEVTVIGLHLNAPISSSWSRRRNRQLAAIGQAVRRIEGPLIVAGDMNVTPWSPHFADFLDVAADLVDAAQGRGWIPTWPVQVPPLRVPIDHILVNSELAVVDLARGPDIGSDHFPLSARLAIRP